MIHFKDDPILKWQGKIVLSHSASCGSSQGGLSCDPDALFQWGHWTKTAPVLREDPFLFIMAVLERMTPCWRGSTCAYHIWCCRCFFSDPSLTSHDFSLPVHYF